MQEEGGKETHLIIFTRALGGGRGRIYWGNEEEIQGSAEEVQGKCDRESKEKKKRWRKREKEDGVRGNIRFMK